VIGEGMENRLPISPRREKGRKGGLYSQITERDGKKKYEATIMYQMFVTYLVLVKRRKEKGGEGGVLSDPKKEKRVEFTPIVSHLPSLRPRGKGGGKKGKAFEAP